MDDLDGAYRVLLVEDDEDDALLVSDLLETWPRLHVDVARTIADAGRRLEQQSVDCVLLDLGLPDAVGLEAIEALIAVDPEIALVVLTGDAAEQRGFDALGAGAQDYLVKGRIDATTLMRAVRYAVERKASARSSQELAVARAHAAENARLHRGLLPAPIVEDPRIAVQTAYQPGRRRQLLGGDFYDVVQGGDGRVHAVMGDVCGHGPDEAALGVRMRMAWRTLILAGAPEEDLLPTLHHVIIHERERAALFTSLAHVSVDPDCCAASVRLAGHPPPIVVDGMRTRLLEECARGPVLGVHGGPYRWPATKVELGGSWSLLLHTDGLYEGHVDAGPARLGPEGLIELLRGHPMTPAAVNGQSALQSLIDSVEELNGGALTDDVAVLTLRCGA